MPRTCSVCKHPRSAEITRAIGKGGSLRALTVEFGFKNHATLHRHKVQCMGLKSAAPVERIIEPVPVRYDADPLDPQALLRRASGLLDSTQAIVNRAEKSGDDRLGLTAIRELRESLALTMRAVGMMQDGGNVYVDQRKIELRTNIGELSVEHLRALAEGRVTITSGTIDQEPSC